jgi:peptidyl-prolyl cis-trans isomerase SurA
VRGLQLNFRGWRRRLLFGVCDFAKRPGTSQRGPGEGAAQEALPRKQDFTVLQCRLATILVLVSILAVGSLTSGQTVDRIVASIGHNGITESDVTDEFRFESFVESCRIQASPPSVAVFRKVESRLIDQKLLGQQLPSYPADPDIVRKGAEEQVNTVRKECKTSRRFDAALHSLGLGQPQLRSRLEQQQHILMMIDDRLRPAATVAPRDIEDYYQKTFVPDFRRRYDGAPPPLSQVQDKIRQILVQARINQLLGQWLTQLKQEQNVHILSN